ncbi:MAG: molybdopterin-dependent oxidoreductase, partial [Euzebyales bacterium]|nr:molybdopterin-dependent oxidoreductase [Euzebyales bacterium]
GLEAAAAVAGLPGAERRQTGSHESGSGDPAAMPVTQWLDDRIPAVDASAWRLAVTTAAGTRTVGLADLPNGDRVTATIDCTGGWYATQEWTGVPLDRLLGDVGDARSVLVRSVTGYSRRFPARDLPRLLLATGAGGAPLSPGHGFPARIVAPGRRGFWWVKWVTDITIDDRPWWLQPPFPLQ